MIRVVFVRYGATGRRLAALIRRGTGEDRGLVFVRPWIAQRSALLAERAIPKEELRGKPRKNESQVEAIKKALENEQKR